MAGHAAAQLSRRQRRRISDWKEFNSSAPLLIDAFESWISNGKIDDAPKNAPISFAALIQAQANLKPSRAQRQQQLAAAVRRQHAGRRRTAERRPCDARRAARPRAAQLLGDLAGLPHRQPGQHGRSRRRSSPARNITWRRSIGNAGNWGAGRKFAGVPPHMFVLGDALAFNTFLSPNFPLPALSNLDPTAANPQLRAVFPGQGELRRRGLPLQRRRRVRRLKTAMASFTPAQLRRALGRGLAEGQPSVREDPHHRRRERQHLQAGRQPPPPLTARFQSAHRPPHRPAQPGAVRHDADGDQGSRCGRTSSSPRRAPG